MATLTREQIVSRLDTLPTLPSVVTRILEIVLNEESSAKDAAAVVESDLALSTKVLRIVNSPAYGLRQKVSTVSHAIAMLGFSTLKGLVLSVSVYDCLLEKSGAQGIDKVLFWQHCLAVASAARALAQATEYDLPDEAFVAGLLHDMGKVVLEQTDTPGYRQVLRDLAQKATSTVAAEQEVLGVDHSVAGGWLAEHWNLHEILRDAIRHHHGSPPPETLSPRARHLANIVHVADFVAWTQGIGSVESRRPPLLDSERERELGFQKMELDRITEAIDRDMERMSEVFQFGAPDVGRFRSALQKANVELGRINSLYDEARRNLEKHVRRLKDLNQAIREARQTLDVGGVRRTILRSVQSGLGFDRALLLDLDAQARRVRCVDHEDETNLDLDPRAIEFPFADDDPFLRKCRGSSRTFLARRKDAQGNLIYRILESLQSPEVIVAPVYQQKALSGFVLADNVFSQRGITPDDIESVEILAQEAGLALENARLFEKTKELSIHDDLTKVYNRRQILQTLSTEMERARRYKRAFTLVMCDLDLFKRFNDSFGHLAGDRILQDVARIIRRTSRKEADAVGRYGGEEFICALPETELEQGVVYAERLRQVVEQFGRMRHDVYPDHALTLSLGVATFLPDKDATKEDLIRRADQAMYAAKSRGRNRVCIHRGE